MAAAIETITQVYVSSTSRPTHSTNSSLAIVAEERYQRSLFRRAWDKVESILTSVHSNTSPEEEDDDEEFRNPLNPHRRQLLKEGSISSRISTDSGDERPTLSSSSSRASSIRRYDPWQQSAQDEIQQTKVEHAKIKDMIAGWAMDEVSPWFN